jgi:hypothetical protein
VVLQEKQEQEPKHEPRARPVRLPVLRMRRCIDRRTRIRAPALCTRTIVSLSSPSTRPTGNKQTSKQTNGAAQIAKACLADQIARGGRRPGVIVTAAESATGLTSTAHCANKTARSAQTKQHAARKQDSAQRANKTGRSAAQRTARKDSEQAARNLQRAGVQFGSYQYHRNIPHPC